MMKKILVLDDNLTVCLMLKSWLVKQNYQAETATSVKDAIEMVKDRPFDLILSDIRMPDTDGFSFLSWIKRYDSDILVIMMTGFADVETAVESMKSGAVDYIAKPIDPEILFQKIEAAFKNQSRNAEKRNSQTMFVKPSGLEYQKLFDEMDKAAANETYVLIRGDRGTGKNSIARYIYEKSSRNAGPFVMADCSDVQAVRNAKTEPFIQAFFREARGGVIYVKAVENLDTFSQDLLLSAITTQKRDDSFTMIIACTDKNNDDLKRRLIPKLYQFFEKETIKIPSLRNNKESILFFANYFLNFANSELDKKVTGFSPEVEEAFIRHEWPENIQELKNTVLKAVLMTNGAYVPKELAAGLFKNDFTVTNYGESAINVQDLKKENYEREKIKDALGIAKGNKTLAASILNIDRKTLYNKIKQYQIEIAD